ncbi:MAG: MmgE/PrpD family protein, partial [Chloroflexota bacterium]
AFANAEVMWASGLIDSYRMLTHPGPALIPVALVNAELEGKNGKDLIVALAAGYEFLTRLCDDFIPATAAQGFRPGPVYATMGGAVVAAKVLGLDANGIVSAIDFAANLAGGILTGGGASAIHEPNAARQGAAAALIARRGGLVGSETSIEGPSGFYKTFAGTNKGDVAIAFGGNMEIDLATVTAGLGTEYKLLTIMFRMIATAGYNQPIVDLIVEMMQANGLQTADLDVVEVSMNYIENLYPSQEAFGRADSRRAGEGGRTKFFAANAAVYGGFPVVGGKSFAPEGTNLDTDPAIVDFMANHVKIIPVWGHPMFSPSVTLKTTDGRAFFGHYPYARMEWNLDQLVERLQDCMPGYPGGKPAFDRLVEVVRNLDAQPSMQPVIAAVAG